MAAKQKVVSHAARRARELMLGNLRRRMLEVYPGSSLTEVFEKIRSDTGLSLSTLQRLMSGEVDARLSTIADVAYNLGISLQELFNATDGLPPAQDRASAQTLRRRRA